MLYCCDKELTLDRIELAGTIGPGLTTAEQFPQGIYNP